MIDFGLLSVGDPAGDVPAAWTVLPSDARERFRTAISVEDATWTRGRGWALYAGMIALKWYMASNRALADAGRRWIAAVLCDG